MRRRSTVSIGRLRLRLDGFVGYCRSSVLVVEKKATRKKRKNKKQVELQS